MDPIISDIAMARYDPKLYSQPAIFVQDACQQHQYIRSKDTSGIVERPERLRAVKVGLAVAIARLEELFRSDSSASIPSVSSTADDLADALNRLDIGQVSKSSNKGNSPTVIHSSATVDILNHPAVKFVHGDVDGDVYPGKLKAWASVSWQKISNGESEIPEGLSQGDLYCKYCLYSSDDKCTDLASYRDSMSRVDQRHPGRIGDCL